MLIPDEQDLHNHLHQYHSDHQRRALPLRRRKQPTEPEGPGGQDGVVLPLQAVGSGIYDSSYVLPINVGRENPKTFSVQIDTGSSDLWLTSTDCTSSLCSQSARYDPSISSTDTGLIFSITYLLGSVTGPIVWDALSLGPYTIYSQALAAASDIVNEPLSREFNGILGLALPLNSIISDQIPAGTTDDPDGAMWASNLFSAEPRDTAPRDRFLSLTLSRPGSEQFPAVLGIGRHPQDLDIDPSLIEYSPLIPDALGVLFWKVNVKAITVYVNGEPKKIELGRSAVQGQTGSRPLPTAVLDSGVPLILTTRRLANAIYGAVGVNPASDGQYYVPCDLPLNLTISLDDRTETPIHPLDLTTNPPQSSPIDAQFCIGLIQSIDSAIASSSPNSPPPSMANGDLAPVIADIILGVPFMRNVYTVMAYTPPSSNGTFPIPTAEELDGPLRPRLGLLSLTNSTRALQEFHLVRVLNQPIDTSLNPNFNPNGSGSSGNGNGNGVGIFDGTSGSKRLSVGVIALLGILGFFAFCFALFGLRWLIMRSRERRSTKGYNGVGHSAGGGGAAVAAAAVMPAGKETDKRREKNLSSDTSSSAVSTFFLSLFSRGKHSSSSSYDDNADQQHHYLALAPTQTNSLVGRDSKQSNRTATLPLKPSVSRGSDRASGSQADLGVTDVEHTEDELREMKFEAYLREKAELERRERRSVVDTGMLNAATIVNNSGANPNDDWDPETALDWSGKSAANRPATLPSSASAPARTSQLRNVASTSANDQEDDELDEGDPEPGYTYKQEPPPPSLSDFLPAAFSLSFIHSKGSNTYPPSAAGKRGDFDVGSGYDGRYGTYSKSAYALGTIGLTSPLLEVVREDEEERSREGTMTGENATKKEPPALPSMASRTVLMDAAVPKTTTTMADAVRHVPTAPSTTVPLIPLTIVQVAPSPIPTTPSPTQIAVVGPSSPSTQFSPSTKSLTGPTSPNPQTPIAGMLSPSSLPFAHSPHSQDQGSPKSQPSHHTRDGSSGNTASSPSAIGHRRSRSTERPPELPEPSVALPPVPAATPPKGWGWKKPFAFGGSGSTSTSTSPPGAIAPQAQTQTTTVTSGTPQFGFGDYNDPFAANPSLYEGAAATSPMHPPETTTTTTTTALVPTTSSVAHTPMKQYLNMDFSNLVEFGLLPPPTSGPAPRKRDSGDGDTYTSQGDDEESSSNSTPSANMAGVGTATRGRARPDQMLKGHGTTYPPSGGIVDLTKLAGLQVGGIVGGGSNGSPTSPPGTGNSSPTTSMHANTATNSGNFAGWGAGARARTLSPSASASGFKIPTPFVPMSAPPAATTIRHLPALAFSGSPNSDYMNSSPTSPTSPGLLTNSNSLSSDASSAPLATPPSLSAQPSNTSTSFTSMSQQSTSPTIPKSPASPSGFPGQRRRPTSTMKGPRPPSSLRVVSYAEDTRSNNSGSGGSGEGRVGLSGSKSYGALDGTTRVSS